MNKTIEIPVSEICPTATDVLTAQGIDPSTDIKPRVQASLDISLSEFQNIAEPRALIMDIDQKAFDSLYHGEGKNQSPTPLENIYPKADRLMLCAATVGGAIDARIKASFSSTDFLDGSFFDSIGSLAADAASRYLENYILNIITGNGAANKLTKVVCYSPGYCGWDISGQKALFDTLHPDRIGIVLRESCLMEPMKTISGVLIAGDTNIHRFVPDFPFCDDCKAYTCRVNERR